MEPQDRKHLSLIAIFWLRIGQILFGDLSSKSDGKALPPKVLREVRFLERCLLEDCLVEKYRKQLERQWQEVSH